ncbi:hypothetical protein [Niallia nealsonii]|uniref:Uncharacterized protein n=1 Tax=Niallia nealsonii TaxID=115979 RepID=A0A2N0Z4I6_9BACI|nr:hypothetical protein [Niallia nealsonii]PKG24399.1 hypothetical protein CWS01_07250 [Niallia nealsonii]
MFLYFPEKFDENEWTIIVTVIINVLIFSFLPKKIPKEITPLIVLLSISFPKVMDHSMAVKPFELYDLTDTSKYELFDLVLYGAYPAFGYLFVYFSDYFKGLKLVLYFIFWNMIAIGIEFLLVKLHVFVYTGWKLIYSLPVYTVVISITYLFYRFATYYNNKNSFRIPSNK